MVTPKRRATTAERNLMIDANAFECFVHCWYKAYLKAAGVLGEVTEYESVPSQANARFKESALDRLLVQNKDEQIAFRPRSMAAGIRGRSKLIQRATVEALGVRLTFDMLERQADAAEDHQPA